MAPLELRAHPELLKISNEDRPMQVFLVGMPRSGTMSMVAAFRILGYTTYDFVDRLLLEHMPLWTEAMVAKFKGKGQPWAREEFDKVFKGFDCVVDMPCTLFVEELVEAYLNAVFVLNKRNLDTWHVSMTNTIFHVNQWASWPLLAKLDPGLAGTWYEHAILTWEVFSGGDYGEVCKEKAFEHYETVRKVVPKERLLEYEVKQGWKPLCELLVKNIPAGEFPNVNDGATFLDLHKKLWVYGILGAVRNVVLGILAVMLVVGAWYLHVRK